MLYLESVSIEEVICKEAKKIMSPLKFVKQKILLLCKTD